jgi:hypothetical protein
MENIDKLLRDDGQTPDLATLKLRERKLQAKAEAYRTLLWLEPGKQDEFSKARLRMIELQLSELNEKIAGQL